MIAAEKLVEKAIHSVVASRETVKLLATSGTMGALTGAAAGAGVALATGLTDARREPGRDGYSVVGAALFQVSNGAILGVVGGVAAAATGLGVAALVGRGLLALMAPALVGTAAAVSVQGAVSRFTRNAGDSLAGGLRARFGERQTSVGSLAALPPAEKSAASA